MPRPVSPPVAGDWGGWRDYLARPRGGGRHEWNGWQSYLAVHEGRLRAYSPNFLLADRLSFTATDVGVVWQGTLVFALGLEVQVDKEQELRSGDPGGPHVRTATYAYEVLRRTAGGEVQLWRYDNTGRHGHETPHHLHVFRADGTAEIVHLGEAGWPTLGDVVEDLFAWWSALKGGLVDAQA